MIALMIAILFVAAILSAMTAMRFAIRGREVAVPQVVGRTEDEARQIGAAATLLGITLYPNSKPSETREAYQFRENIDGRRYWLLMTTKDGGIGRRVCHLFTGAINGHQTQAKAKSA